MEECTCSYEEVKQLKQDKILELPWAFLEESESEFFSKFVVNNCVCAVLRVSIDPLDEDVMWIEEFEILSAYRGQGIGLNIICEFLKDCDNVVKLMAKNKSVAKFWHKCGFQYESSSCAEIPMIYCK